MRRVRFLARFVTAACVIAPTICCAAPAAKDLAAVKTWESFDFRKRAVKADELKALTSIQLKYMRGIVFAKHGREFGEKVIQQYLESRPWYQPSGDYAVSQLNDNERKTMDAIKEAEWRQHKQIEPGDLKFHRNHRISEKELGKHTRDEWKIMLAEVEAIHGKSFPDDHSLQEFFDQRYWYHPAKKYDPRQLNDFERKNLETIAAAAKNQRNLRLAPGDMALFQSKPITNEMLDGLSLYELRLLRNEVYARRGRLFRTAWLQDYFRQQIWYRALPDFREPKLTALETKNIDTIVKRERRIHEELSTQALKRELVEGLFLEDARKLRYEVYARRGKVFKDRWLQGYFASFKWYRPDPKFSEQTLSDIERKNMRSLIAYEKTAERHWREVAA